MTPALRELIEQRNMIVCCGAGGVGKTTTATAIALAAARSGRRVLALTVDPSRRLAETLGVARNLTEPTKPPQRILDAAGIQAPGTLEAWMLDPQLVSDKAVAKLAKSPEAMERLRNNRIYKELSRMVAGMQEYTAMEALHDFIKQDRYDLVVLDTPPARNALDFLEGPGRLAEFFDGAIFGLFLPADNEGFIKKKASELIGKVMSAVFGPENFDELRDFFAHFADIFGKLNENAGEMRKLLSDDKRAAFLLVTSPAPEAITDAFFFRKQTQKMRLPFEAFILNRSDAVEGGRGFPDDSLVGADASPALASAVQKLRVLATLEHTKAQRDVQLLKELADKAGRKGKAMALPTIPAGANDIPALMHLADALMTFPAAES